MVCAAATLHGMHKGKMLNGTPVTDDEGMKIPDYIRKAWGVTSLSPSPVQLAESTTGVMAVFYAVLERRVAIGDAFVEAMSRARSGRAVDVWNTARTVPKPNSAIQTVEKEYYSAQATFALNSRLKSVFCDGQLPKISLRDYVARFFTHCPVPEMSFSVYLLMLIFLDKVAARCPGSFLHSYNAHRMVLGAFVVAAKYHEDDYVLQPVFAKHGGVTVKDLNEIEKTFLEQMDYRCYTNQESYEALEVDLMQEALESPSAQSVLNTLRNERIRGVEVAVARINTKGTSCAPPRLLGSPVSKGDMLHGVQLESQVEADFYNYLLEVKNTREWESKRARANGMLVCAHARALIMNLFPGMPSDPEAKPTEESWRIWCYRAGRMTKPQHDVYQSLYGVLRTIQRGPNPIELKRPSYVESLPNPWPGVLDGIGPFAQQLEAVDHSTCIAKSAVSFILNDNDPFADLKMSNVPSAAQQCGGQPLLMQW